MEESEEDEDEMTEERMNGKTFGEDELMTDERLRNSKPGKRVKKRKQDSIFDNIAAEGSSDMFSGMHSDTVRNKENFLDLSPNKFSNTVHLFGYGHRPGLSHEIK
ncbi:MAG: hypothetical protein KDK36_08260, partial [Leptospiraceae bacterium]|nr:hypothetical protein [Leptospiraceae bacterium]